MEHLVQGINWSQVLSEAENLWKKGEHQKATEVLEESIQKYQNASSHSSSSDIVNFLYAKNTLALFYQLQGRVNEATKIYHEIIPPLSQQCEEFQHRVRQAKERGIILRAGESNQNPFNSKETLPTAHSLSEQRSITHQKTETNCDNEAEIELQETIRKWETQLLALKTFHASTYHDLGRTYEITHDYFNAQEYYNRAIQLLVPHMRVVDEALQQELNVFKEFVQEQKKKKEKENKVRQSPDDKESHDDLASASNESQRQPQSNRKDTPNSPSERLQQLQKELNEIGLFIAKFMRRKDLSPEQVDEINEKKKRALHIINEMREMTERAKLPNNLETSAAAEAAATATEYRPESQKITTAISSSSIPQNTSLALSYSSKLLARNEGPRDPTTQLPAFFGLFHANLGMLYEHIGNYKEAEKSHNISFKYCPAIERWDHPHFATLLHPRQQRLENEIDDTLYQEIECVDSLITQIQKFFNPADTFVLPLKIYSATLFRLLGRFPRAHAILYPILRQATQSKGDLHAFTATLKVHLGLLNFAENELEEAERYLFDALRTRQKLFGYHHLHVGLISYDLGLILAARGKRSDGLYLLENSTRLIYNVVNLELHPALLKLSHVFSNLEKQAQSQPLSSLLKK